MQSSKTVGAVINKSNIQLLQISRNLPQISNTCAENLTTRNQPDHLDTFVYHSLARCIRNFICAECRPKSKDIYPKQPKPYPINKPTFLVSSSITLTRNYSRSFRRLPHSSKPRCHRFSDAISNFFATTTALATHVTKIKYTDWPRGS